jgi:plasmid stability protein
MANLQVRDIDEKLYESLRTRAHQERRSISQEVIHILEKYLSLPTAYDQNPTDEFLKLAGSWEDNRTSEEIIADIRQNRKNSPRFSKSHELFD